MGIQGLLSYIKESSLMVPHRLHDTALVIDGLSLENELYREYLLEYNDKAFGGDYTYFVEYIRPFFSALTECNVTPIVIMDGSYEAGKVNKKKDRFDQQAASSRYDNPSSRGEEIKSLLIPFVLVEVIKSMNIECYQGIYETEYIIPQIGYDLNCPILSGYSDHFVFDLPGGVVSLKPFIDSRLEVKKGDGISYLDCELYKVDALKRKFTGLRGELIPLSSAILGNDYLDYQQAKKLIGKFPPPPFRHAKFRHAQIYSVYAWLASQSSYENAVAALKRMAGYQSPLVKYIQDRQVGQLHKSGDYSNLSVHEYFSRNRLRLFKREPKVPAWAHELLIDYRMQKRLISIFCKHFDFLQPLVKDFSLKKSSHECCFDLRSYIYGLLRSCDQSPKPVTCFVRQGHALDQRVTPAIEIGSEKLPLFEDVGEMSETKRRDWFFRIIGVDQSLVDNIKKIVQEQKNITIDEAKLNVLATMLLSAVYLARHYSDEFSIEFFYALLVNIILMGHFTKSQITDDDGHVVLLEFSDTTEHKALTDKLSQFDWVPRRDIHPYQPRIAHLYNSFQNCLSNIHFLGQILNLSQQFHANQCFSGLQGTFIYNLARELATQDTPLAHLEENILADQSEGKQHLELFSKLLDLVLNESKRKYFICGGNDGDKEMVDRAIVPQNIYAKNSAESGRFFSLGFKN